MKIGLIATSVGGTTSGPSRFLVNIAQGLVRENISVSVHTLSIQPEAERFLSSLGVRVVSEHENALSTIGQARILTRFNKIGRRLQRTLSAKSPPDWYVVLSDDAMPIIDFIGQLGPGTRTAFVCNGDYSLLLLSPSFRSSAPALSRLLGLGFVAAIEVNRRRAVRFDVLLANSHFTQGLMGFLYNTPFHGIVYPPVDLAVFRQSKPAVAGNFVLAVARNQREQNLDLLQAIAREVPLKVVGGAQVPAAECLGVVPDYMLIDLYAEAAFLAFPSVSEFFGYPVAESLACGSPVLAFDGCGPGELITESVNGWLVRTGEDFVTRAVSLFKDGFSPNVRIAALKASERYSIQASVGSLLEHLRRQSKS